ncbi:MAG: hypothetical protein SGARI_004657 [Bacillariaceae sp.]
MEAQVNLRYWIFVAPRISAISWCRPKDLRASGPTEEKSFQSSAKKPPAFPDAAGAMVPVGSTSIEAMPWSLARKNAVDVPITPLPAMITFFGGAPEFMLNEKEVTIELLKMSEGD